MKFKSDLSASVIVFLVALPLCLGIALASGAPLFAGLIAGVVGGIVVGSLSRSALGVSGPAAGLAVIVLAYIQDLGSYESFLLAVVIAGLFQIAMGFLKAGGVAYFFPSSVIHGMLAGIGMIIILKQIPHAFGYDETPEGFMGFLQPDQQNTFSELNNMLSYLSSGPITIAVISLLILILWETQFLKKYKVCRVIQGPLIAVVAGITMNVLFLESEQLKLTGKQSVNIPDFSTVSGFFANFQHPDMSQLLNPHIYVVALILAVVASLETLLCVEATDKLDPKRRVTPTNRELKAQGVGNVISGLLGGLPVTQVIVRSSANIQAGAETKASAIFHGFIILFAVISIPQVLNLIPLASLAAILMVVGFKLAQPDLFKKYYKQGIPQFAPFMATILGILFTDLLIGVCIGLAVSVFFILYQNFRIPIVIEKELKEDGDFVIQLTEDVSFLKKASLLKVLSEIPDDRDVTIDASKTYYIHNDVIDIIEDFQISANNRNIKVHLIELYDHKEEDPVIHVSHKPHAEEPPPMVPLSQPHT